MVDDPGSRGGFYAEEPSTGGALDRYRTLVNAVDDGLYQLDSAGAFVAVNDALCELTGYEREELLGEPLSVLLDETDVARVDAMVHSMIAHDLDGTPVDVAVGTKRGEVRPCEVVVSVLEGADGFEGTVGVVRHVAERADADHRLTATTDRYESLVEDVLDDVAMGVVVVDADGTVAWVNGAAERYFGLDRADVIGREERRVADEYLLDAVADPDGLAITEGPTAAREADVECQVLPGAEREHRWLLSRSNPIETGRYAGGRVDLYYDVTDRKQSERIARDCERRLSEEQAFTESLFDAQPDIVYAIDVEGWPLRWNNRVSEVSGYADAEIAWMNALDFVADRARDRAREALGDIVEDGEVVTVALPLETAAGEEISYQFSGAPLTDDDGEIVGLTGVGRDISTLRAQARRLERQRDELEAELQDVFDRIDDAFFALDPAYRFTYLNERAEELLDVSAADVIGEDVREVAHVSDATAEAIVSAYDAQEQVTVQDDVPGLDATVESHVYPSETGVSVYFRDVTARERRKRELDAQRERLAVLDDLNGVVRGVTDAVLEQSTRDEVERAVVEGLVDSASYTAAWIGRIEPGAKAVTASAAAGPDEWRAADGATVERVGDDPARPALRALESGQIDVCRGEDGECPGPPGADARLDGGSSAAIPIAHRENRYGVLAIYTERPAAFGEREREVIGQLGEVVGHAIAALDRKRALASDEVIEVEFLAENAFGDVDGVESVSGITFEQAIPVGDGRYHVYGTATAEGLDALEWLPETASHVTGVRTVSQEGDLRAFELHQTEAPLSMALATHGGTIKSAVVEDGDLRVTVQVPPGVPIRSIREAVQEIYPGASLLAQRQVTRAEDTAHRVLSALETELTERQRVILKAAYFAGYFEWPRGSTGEELAESLDIAPATFSQHLRTAQRRLFGVLFDDGADSEE